MMIRFGHDHSQEGVKDHPAHTGNAHVTHTRAVLTRHSVRPLHRHARRATFRLASGKQVRCTAALLPLRTAIIDAVFQLQFMPRL
jgi:hypothetical protein